MDIGARGRLSALLGSVRADIVVAAGLLVLVEAVVLNRAAVSHPAPPAAALLGAATAVPVAVRRRSPVVALAVSGVALLVLVAVDRAPGPATFGPLLAMYTVATSCARRLSTAAVVAGVVGLASAAATASGPNGWARAAFPAVGIVVAWLVGDNVRVRRAYVAELEARAVRTERDRREETARAAEQERLRIARELHDVIAHHVSVIAIQAGGLRLRRQAATVAADTDAAVEAIEQTARQTLAELRRLLGVLRHGDGARSAELLAPQPGLAQLDELLEQVRAAGLPVRVRVEGDSVALPSALDLSAYRLVQEALTNVLKHQGPVETDVVIRYATDRLGICVTSRPGEPRRGSDEVGHGLIGMRERVAMFGGRLSAGPRPDRGFEVVAELPLAGGAT